MATGRLRFAVLVLRLTETRHKYAITPRQHGTEDTVDDIRRTDESQHHHREWMSAVTHRQHGTEDTMDDIRRTDESHHHHHKRMSATRKKSPVILTTRRKSVPNILQ